MLPKKLNVGEWSESYTFLKILVDPLIVTCNHELQPLDNDYVTAKEILFFDRPGKKSFKPKSTYDDFSKEDRATINWREIRDELPSILQDLKTSRTNKGSFEMPRIEAVFRRLGIESLKMQSTSKIDIEILLEGVGATQSPEGYSIKSLLSGEPTLLNASKQTNFMFEVDGPHKVVLDRFKMAKRYKPFVDSLESDFGELRFLRAQSAEFTENLKDYGDDFPQFLSGLILQKFRVGKKVPLKDLVENLVPTPDISRREFQLKNFLKSAALGMVPGTRWNNQLQGYGGYLVVSPDGEILRLPLKNEGSFCSYLYNNTYLDTPSKKLWIDPKEMNGRTELSLNFSIRFLK